MSRLTTRFLLAAFVAAASSTRARAQDAPTPADEGAAFDRLAAFTTELAGVGDLTDGQRDSLAAIERAYRPRFRRAGAALLATFAAARETGEPADVETVRRLDATVRALWLDEVRDTRRVLREGTQRARFDANVAAHRGEEAP